MEKEELIKTECDWCGNITPMVKMQLPETPILEWMEEKINKAGRKDIWGENARWYDMDLDSGFEAELLLYDELLGKIRLRSVCENCLEDDDRLWEKYYGVRFEDEFVDEWDDFDVDFEE